MEVVALQSNICIQETSKPATKREKGVIADQVDGIVIGLHEKLLGQARDVLQNFNDSKV